MSVKGISKLLSVLSFHCIINRPSIAYLSQTAHLQKEHPPGVGDDPRDGGPRPGRLVRARQLVRGVRVQRVVLALGVSVFVAGRRVVASR